MFIVFEFINQIDVVIMVKDDNFLCVMFNVDNSGNCDIG